MYYNKSLYFIIFAIALSAGSALKCFKCFGPPNGGCANANGSDLIKMTCRQGKFINKPTLKYSNTSDLTFSCVQLEFAEPSNAVQRACVEMPPGADFCESFEQDYNLKECSTCTDDYCNIKPIK